MDKNLWGVPKDPPGLNRVKALKPGKTSGRDSILNEVIKL